MISRGCGPVVFLGGVIEKVWLYLYRTGTGEITKLGFIYWHTVLALYECGTCIVDVTCQLAHAVI